MRVVATSFLFALSVALPVAAGVHEVWWNLSYAYNVSPDGLVPRRAIGVNGTWPSAVFFCSLVLVLTQKYQPSAYFRQRQ
jgi:hypothetical protein